MIDTFQELKLKLLKSNLKQSWSLPNEIWNEEIPHDYMYEDTYLQLSFVFNTFSQDELLQLIKLTNNETFDGINENSEVRISGMQVGKVMSMQIINNKPLIKLALNKDLLIPDDSSLSIQTDGLFGKKYISLEPGGSEKFLNNGEKIFLTEDSILIQDLLKKIIQIGNLKKESYEKYLF